MRTALVNATLQLGLSSAFLLLAACTSIGPTPFESGITYNKDSVVFKGNSETSKKRAAAFSVLGAIKACISKRKIPIVFRPLDKSITETYTEVSAYSYLGSTHIFSRPDTTVTPIFEAEGFCLPRVYQIPGIVLETLPRDLAHSHTKDFKAAVLVASVDGNKADPTLPLKANDIIVSVSGNRIETLEALHYRELPKLQTLHAVFGIIRGDKSLSVKVPLQDFSSDVFFKSLERAASACKQFEPDEPRLALCEMLPTRLSE